MIQFLKRFTGSIGLDRATAYTSAAQMVGTVGGFFTAMFILWCLSKDEIGFYHTFKDVLSIQIFFELGMNTVITQYVAHEMPHLFWQGTILVGEHRNRSRLASLLRFCSRWYLFFSVLLLMVLIIGGTAFFNRYGAAYTDIEWKTPWLILCVTTALNLLLTPLFSFLQGLGKVTEVARYFFWKYLIYLLSVILSFALGAKLYALSVGNISYVIVSLLFLFFTPLGRILWHLSKVRIVETISYVKEIFPFQWKIALSWVSGYFIFRLFTPVLMATEGSATAGQMGMTLTVLTGIQALTYSWTSTKIPLYSGFIEKKQYAPLDSLFNRTVEQATALNLLLLIAFFLVLCFFRATQLTIWGVNIADRFLPLWPLVLMMVPEWLNQFITAWATYLRCHKQEPYLINSVVTGLLCCLSTMGLGRAFGLSGITIGYCLITIGVTPWAYAVYRKKKREWHQPE